MKRWIASALLGIALPVGLWAGDAAAQAAKIMVGREENTPKTVEIKAGEEIQFVSGTGGTAHVWFAGNEGARFYVGGKGGGRVKFEKPGTYEYTVHVSGTKVHTHTGTVVVK